MKKISRSNNDSNNINNNNVDYVVVVAPESVTNDNTNTDIR